MIGRPFLFFMLATAMFLVSFLCGCVPTWIATSSKNIRIVSLYGAGLLVGVSLAVIIPEGMRALYMNSFTQLKSTLPSTFSSSLIEKTEFHKLDYELMEKPGDNLLEAHQIVGLCLVAGFLFMTAIERFFQMLKDKTSTK